MPENPGIAACMRLNAKLMKRVDVLQQVLERIAGKTPCGGPMTKGDDGVPFSPECAHAVFIAHRDNCPRCLSRRALNDCSDLAEKPSCQPQPDIAGKCADCKVVIGGQHLPRCHRQGLVTRTSEGRPA